jgi:sugar O-acyltransferase (sialic acid O-acetyltransferase NeuD family)
MSKRHIAIIGAGGHAEVVASVIVAAGDCVAGFYADVPSIWGTVIAGAPVIGPVSEIASARCSHVIIGIGANAARRKFAEELDMEWATVIHPFSWVHPEVPVGPGSVICAGAIVQPGAHIGAHVILNTKASVDHHCRVGNYAHIAVAHLAGGASIDDGVFLALSSTVLPKVHVGAWATVGAGAVVKKNVQPHSTVVGNPARSLSELRSHSMEAC